MTLGSTSGCGGIAGLSKLFPDSMVCPSMKVGRRVPDRQSHHTSAHGRQAAVLDSSLSSPAGNTAGSAGAAKRDGLSRRRVALGGNPNEIKSKSSLQEQFTVTHVQS